MALQTLALLWNKMDLFPAILDDLMGRTPVPTNASFASNALYASCLPPKLHPQGRVSGAGIERAGSLDQDDWHTTSHMP